MEAGLTGLPFPCSAKYRYLSEGGNTVVPNFIHNYIYHDTNSFILIFITNVRIGDGHIGGWD